VDPEGVPETGAPRLGYSRALRAVLGVVATPEDGPPCIGVFLRDRVDDVVTSCASARLGEEVFSAKGAAAVGMEYLCGGWGRRRRALH